MIIGPALLRPRRNSSLFLVFLYPNHPRINVTATNTTTIAPKTVRSTPSFIGIFLRFDSLDVGVRAAEYHTQYAEHISAQDPRVR